VKPGENQEISTKKVIIRIISVFDQMKKIILLLVLLIGITTVTNSALAQTTNNNRYGPVKSGEVLWHIAGKVRPDKSISHYQAMLALLKINPQAFRVPCNLNTLKVGQMLSIPSAATMQILTHAEAVTEFKRQYEEWKTSRKQKQPIVCPQPEKLVQEETPLIQPEKPLLSRLKEALSPTPKLPTSTTDSNAPVEEERQTVQADKKEESLLKPAIRVVETMPSAPSEKVILPFPVNPDLLLLTVGILIILILFFLAFLIGKRLRKPVSAHSATQPHPIPQSPSSSEKLAAEMASAPKSSSDEIKIKLDQVRAYLAEDGGQITQRVLREVIQKGTLEQQAEAKQLYEITKKMNYLNKHKVKSQSVTASQPDITEDQNWPEVRDKPWPVQQYLPEKKEQVFELIDKIFELLDYELNAQGKLVEAYVNRHQREFFQNTNYEIVEPPEKVVIGKKEDKPLRKPQSEVKPTRYL
jgi:FimV-like protein